MHKEILTDEQKKLLPLLKYFSKDFILVGGTAIALQIAHRRSIDFDLFSDKKIKRRSIKNYLSEKKYSKVELLQEEDDQIHFLVNNVKLTFFYYPFSVNGLYDFNNTIKIPSLINLAAMKALAIGGRSKWKDYVDLYFLLKYHFSINEVAKKAGNLFGGIFNDKLFREQLTYFDDIDYDEAVTFISEPVGEEEIRKFLISSATERF